MLLVLNSAYAPPAPVAITSRHATDTYFLWCLWWRIKAAYEIVSVLFSYSFAFKSSRNGKRVGFVCFIVSDVIGSVWRWCWAWAQTLLIIFLWPWWCPTNVEHTGEIMNRRRPSTLFLSKQTLSIRRRFADIFSSCFIFFLQQFRSMMTFWLLTRLNPCIRSFSPFFSSVPSLDATAKPRSIYTKEILFGGSSLL